MRCKWARGKCENHGINFSASFADALDESVPQDTQAQVKIIQKIEGDPLGDSRLSADADLLHGIFSFVRTRRTQSASSIRNDPARHKRQLSFY